MNVAVLHNPTAGDRDLRRAKLASLLRHAGYQAHFFSLKESIWKKKSALGAARLIVVAGGDGSVRKAVLQLHDLGVPFALLPLGTANNICTSLGIAGKPRKIIKSWRQAARRPIDLGVAQGPWGRRLFIEGVGMGLIARAIEIMSEVGASSEHRPEWREDRLHRDASVVQALAHELKPLKISVSVNGGEAKATEHLLCEIMNISHVGPGFQLAPQANPSDGRFDLVTAKGDDRKKLHRVLADSVRDEKPSSRLARRKIRTLRIRLHEGEFRVDDQIVLNLRSDRNAPRKKPAVIKISILPGACEILVPRGSEGSEN